ncbi:hypothetical protein OF83DRAFT_1169271 [Amylostereum chailletii]|nr:hypothetical protein OF83DRAFT_1169271 [Amylostereum chailletii]
MPACTDCQPARSFQSKQAKRSHMNAVHLLFCQVCNSKCYGPSGLNQHYRSSARHPHCARCGSGFLDRQDLDVHIADKHPRVLCCGVSVPREDLDSHYFSSVNHAKCEPCQTGFEDHNMLEQHNATQHPVWRCRACDKEFPSERDLRKHVNSPGIHPQCEFCNKQFKQISALIDHYASTHLVEALKDTVINAVTDPIPLAEPKPVQAAVGFFEPETEPGPEALPVVQAVTTVDVATKIGQTAAVVEYTVLVETDDIDLVPVLAKSILPAPTCASPKPRSPFFCRVCRVDPCKDITATVCGHLFCHGCIETEVRQNARCPVCNAAVLLFALLRLDLRDAGADA